MNDKEMKACPFCGDVKRLKLRSPNKHTHFIRCVQCGFDGKLFIDIEGATDWWNTRDEKNNDFYEHYLVETVRRIVHSEYLTLYCVDDALSGCIEKACNLWNELVDIMNHIDDPKRLNTRTEPGEPVPLICKCGQPMKFVNGYTNDPQYCRDPFYRCPKCKNEVIVDVDTRTEPEGMNVIFLD